MTPPESVIVTKVTIENCGHRPLHVLELWGNPTAAAARLKDALGFPLPAAGKAQANVLRTGPTTWLIEGAAENLGPALGDDGALTAVGGGYVCVRLSGAGWRSLLMEGGLFDAENPQFATDCVATTLIEHVTVTIRVESETSCCVYVPASYSADLLAFWTVSAGGLPQ